MRFLDSHHHIRNEEEEVAQFSEYCAIVLKELGVVASPEVIDKPARNEILGSGQEPFGDTRATLEELYRKSLKPGIVSNAWHSLERTYRVLACATSSGVHYLVEARRSEA